MFTVGYQERYIERSVSPCALLELVPDVRMSGEMDENGVDSDVPVPGC